jgi:hypothetical protein
MSHDTLSISGALGSVKKITLGEALTTETQNTEITIEGNADLKQQTLVTPGRYFYPVVSVNKYGIVTSISESTAVDVVAMIASRASNQNFSDQTWSTVNWPNDVVQVHYNSGGAMNLASGEWTCPSTGLYVFHFNVAIDVLHDFSLTTTATDIAARIRKVNGTAYDIALLNRVGSQVTRATETWLSLSGISYLLIGDKVHFQVRTNKGGGPNSNVVHAKAGIFKMSN